MTQSKKFIAPTNKHEITVLDAGAMRISMPGMDYVRGYEPTNLQAGRVYSLREYFLSERDTELGVWRWVSSTGKHYLVRKLGYGDQFRVVSEEHMEQLDWRPEEYNMETHQASEMVKAIRAYLDAHPEPKPWHDAKPGEVWLFKGSTDPGPLPFVFSPTDNLWINPAGHRLNEKYTEDRPYGYSLDPNFEPRRIWPETEEN